MYNNTQIVALIPARGGSKGVPGKNIKLFLGKPLIAWTIEQALASRYLDRIIVSTDDNKIAEISKQYGAEVPFMRPGVLATDRANSIDVVLHAIEWLEKNTVAAELMMLLQPTSPLRTCEDIDGAIDLLFERNAQAVISVCEVEHHPYWTNILPPDGCMRDFLRPEVEKRNRQELPTFYRLNGAVYLGYREYITRQAGFFGSQTYAFVMPQYRSIDIDSEVDFKLGESIMSRL